VALFRIHVASAVDERYLPHVLSVAKSISASSEWHTRVAYHVLYDGPDGDLPRTVARHRDAHLRIYLHNVANPLRDLPTQAHVSSATYLRFMLPDLLRSLRRVIYLDADVVVHRDIGDLWRTPLGGHPIAGVRDFPIIAENDRQERAGEGRLVRYFREVLHIDPETYVNAGVLLLDLHRLRLDSFGARGLAISRDRHSELKWGDQDVINIEFDGRKNLLDSRWNFIPALDERKLQSLRPGLRVEALRQREGPFITHHAGPNKPWD
jgi:lipopolysaccharide biosynthesis glycosyltransferase